MRLSINAEHFCDRADGTKRTLEGVLSLCADAGFTCVDLLAAEPDAEQTAMLLEKYALSVNQSHCPFNRYVKKDYTLFAEDIRSAARSAHLLGAEIFVVHGDEFDFGAESYSDEAALEFNYRLFSPIVEQLDTYGMKLAFENVFPDMNTPRFCSTPEQILKLVGKFPKENVGICLDTGHASVADEVHYLENIRSYADRIIATHIHDNYYGKDLHLFPFLGELDLPACVRILKDVGYTGDFTYEFVYDRTPDEFLPEVLALLYRCGKYLLR